MKKRIKTLNYGKKAVYIYNKCIENNTNYHFVRTSLFNDVLGYYAVLNKNYEELIPFDENRRLISIQIIDENRFIAVFLRNKEFSLHDNYLYEYFEIKANKIDFSIPSESEIEYVNSKVIGSNYIIDDYNIIKKTDTFIYDIKNGKNEIVPDVNLKEIINNNLIVLFDYNENSYYLYDINKSERVSMNFSCINGIYDIAHERHPEMFSVPYAGKVDLLQDINEKQIIKIIIAAVKLPEFNINGKTDKTYELITFLDTNFNYITPIYDTLNNKIISTNVPNFSLQEIKAEFLESALEKRKNIEEYTKLVRRNIGK